MRTFADLGIQVPDILLPAHTELKKWSVIACDQYTQDRSYWEKAAESADGEPSTLNLILPEVYLNDSDKEQRIARIKRTMSKYCAEGVFAPARHGFIYTERTTSFGRVRCGLIAAIDLETYEWKPFSTSLIRATEATIIERIPPRKEIRRGAPLELPHIMLLVNDPSHIFIEKAGQIAKSADERPAYSGPLMMNGGSISGWFIPEDRNKDVLSSLNAIADANTKDDGKTFLFAVGDGNHSLATAKAVWDEYKTTLNDTDRASSSVRYALVEIVNIYDKGLTFEPIHRVLFDTDIHQLTAALKAALGGAVHECTGRKELEDSVRKSSASFGFASASGGKTSYMLLETSVKELAVSRLQPAVDAFLQEQNKSGKNSTIDYIHGADELFRLCTQPGTTGILLPPVAKDSFFDTINSRGPLPRKSFSMGEADEKRFYLECRRLF